MPVALTGATVDWGIDQYGWLALQDAAWRGHTNVVRLLLDAGWSLEGGVIGIGGGHLCTYQAAEQ